MPVSNSTYTRGSKAKTKGASEKAAMNRQRFSQTRFAIRFRNNGLEFETIKKRS